MKAPAKKTVTSEPRTENWGGKVARITETADVAPGTPDYVVDNSGSIFLVVAQNNQAHDNLKEHAQEGAQFFGRALAVEHRYIVDLVAQLQNEGWNVQ